MEMKYKTPIVVRSLLRIDILCFCYYCINFPKNEERKKRNGKGKKEKSTKITRVNVGNIIKYLSYYDFNYIRLNPFIIRNEIKLLFPIFKNNHRKNKNFKINNSLIIFWGKEFNINYKQHKEIYKTFNILQNGKMSVQKEK